MSANCLNMRSGFRDFCRILLFAIFFSSSVRAHAQTSVWIDTDPAMGMFLKDYDDSIALAYALKSPRLRVEGISISYGNGSIKQSVPVAKSIVQQFGSDPKTQTALIYPGANSRGYLALATEATVGLQLALQRKKLVYVALGPLTNLATLIQTRPALAKNIDQVIWVAGRAPNQALKIGTTNPYSFHDSNFEKDPTSATIVLESKIPITLVSRELADDFLLTRENQSALSNSGASGKWLAKELDHWLTLWKTAWNIEGGPILDVLPLVMVAYPTSVQTEPAFAGVSMKLDKMVPPKTDENGQYLLISPTSATSWDRPVTNVRSIEATAREEWLKAFTGK